MSPDAGYSGTPLARKLGIKPGSRVAIVHAPVGFMIAGTDGASIDTTVRTQSPSYDVVVLFCVDSTTAQRDFARHAGVLVDNGGLWVAWPKRASGVPTDLDDAVVRALGLDGGLVDVKVCAIDATWSGLKFVRRLADRPPKVRPGGQT